MQDLRVEKDGSINSKDSSSTNTSDAVNDAIIEDILYQIIDSTKGRKDDDESNTINNYPEAEFHHITLKSQLISPHEDYEKLRANENWTMPSIRNRGLKYEGRITRHRAFTLMVCPVGIVDIMIRCTKDPFRWFPREDWIVLYDICSSIQRLLGEHLELGISNSLVHSTHLDWLVTQLHLGYDIQVTDKEKRKGIKTLDLSKFSITIRVRNLHGISCQVYVKRMPHKGATVRLEEHINFSAKRFDSHQSNERSTNFAPSPSLQSLKNTITPKSVEMILDNIYSR